MEMPRFVREVFITILVVVTCVAVSVQFCLPIDIS